MGANDRAQNVMCIRDRAHPIPHRLVDRVAKCPRSSGHGADLSPEHFHALNIGLLPADILLAHVDNTGYPKMCTGRGRRDSVLASTSLRNDSFFSHSNRQQSLTEGTVNFVSTRMIQILSLKPNLRSTAMLS